MLGSILGGIMGVASANKQNALIEAEQKKNEQWYNRRYNEVGTERADAQAALTAMRDAQRARSANARGASVVAGGTAESAAAEKAAQNAAMASAISSINVANEARKDSVENKYMSRDASISAAKLQAEKDKATAIAQAGAGLDATLNKALGAFLPTEK